MFKKNRVNPRPWVGNFTRIGRRRGLVVLLAVLGPIGPGMLVGAGSFDVELGTGLIYDTNVYRAELGTVAERDSMISELSAEVRWREGIDGLQLFYRPRAQRFWSERTEDHVQHDLGFNYRGGHGPLSFQIQSTQTRVQGASQAVEFDGGRNAFATAAVRGRRNQWQNRSSGQFRIDGDTAFVRVLGNLVYFDIDTERLVGAARPLGYDNWINRYDLWGGVDVGHRMDDRGELYLGVRRGYIHQGDQGARPSSRSSHYTRAVIGYTGQFHERVSGRIEAGPSRHDYRSGPGALRLTRLYLDASLSAQLDPKNQLSFRAVERQWVSGSGFLGNRDMTYGLTWTHQSETLWTSRVGFLARGLNYDGSPVNDWLYTLSSEMTYLLRSNLRLGLQLELSRARDEKRDLTARSYDRTWAGIFLSREL